MQKSTILEVTLMSEIHQVKHYEVDYCGLKYSVMLAGSTFNYDGEEIESKSRTGTFYRPFHEP